MNAPGSKRQKYEPTQWRDTLGRAKKDAVGVLFLYHRDEPNMPQCLDCTGQVSHLEYQRPKYFKSYPLLINLFIGLWCDRYMAMWYNYTPQYVYASRTLLVADMFFRVTPCCRVNVTAR